MKKKILLIVALLIGLTVVYWVSTHAYIEILLEGSATNVTYELISKNGDTQTIKGSSYGKKLVRKGQYELSVSRGETSYFAVVKTGGFLSVSTVKARLMPEKNRKYIGNNPSACMYVLGKILASNTCGDLLSEMKIHTPATINQPTYNKNFTSSIDGSMEGVVDTPDGKTMFLRSSAGDKHVAYLVQADFGLTNETTMTALDPNKEYSLQPYKEGFIAYDGLLSKILYYPSIKSSGSPVSVAIKNNKKLKPYAVKAQGNVLLTAYSNYGDEGDTLASGHDAQQSTKSTKKPKTVIVIMKDQQAKQYEFKKRIFAFQLCGNEKLCLISNKQLEVYDISTNKPHLIFTVSDVENIHGEKNRLLVVKQKFVLELNVESHDGFMVYSLGDYSFCGDATTSLGYVLCVSNARGRSALLIDSSADNADSIDKKIAKLSSLPEVKSVSIYEKLILVTPELGELVYDQASGDFDYAPEVRQNASSKIKQAIDDIGIDRSVYKITNIFE